MPKEAPAGADTLFCRTRGEIILSRHIGGRSSHPRTSKISEYALCSGSSDSALPIDVCAHPLQATYTRLNDGEDLLVAAPLTLF